MRKRKKKWKQNPTRNSSQEIRKIAATSDGQRVFNASRISL